MRRLKDRAQVAEQAANPRRRKPAVALEQLIQRHAVDIFHDDARALLVVDRRVVEGRGAAVFKAGQELDLAPERLTVMLVRGDLLAHHLDHHLAIGYRLTSQVDFAHVALAQQANGMVAGHESALGHRPASLLRARG